METKQSLVFAQMARKWMKAIKRALLGSYSEIHWKRRTNWNTRSPHYDLYQGNQKCLPGNNIFLNSNKWRLAALDLVGAMFQFERSLTHCMAFRTLFVHFGETNSNMVDCISFICLLRPFTWAWHHLCLLYNVPRFEMTEPHFEVRTDG